MCYINELINELIMNIVVVVIIIYSNGSSIKRRKTATYHMAWTDTGLKTWILLSVDTLKPLRDTKRNYRIQH